MSKLMNDIKEQESIGAKLDELAELIDSLQWQVTELRLQIQHPNYHQMLLDFDQDLKNEIDQEEQRRWEKFQEYRRKHCLPPFAEFIDPKHAKALAKILEGKDNG